ncbi:hypothetical protein Celaphus_00012774 [Cervus elaphus hippelaphus]|uniref:Uncharacterized protein n=1 Tax=Cervus elaphus hippelaphus TaxID=46360 RepID=A0A212CI91_CEREH|nr:hypothetical protein Celaphus_00012774 [Cervus elaphus hippelaphus]
MEGGRCFLTGNGAGPFSWPADNVSVLAASLPGREESRPGTGDGTVPVCAGVAQLIWASGPPGQYTLGPSPEVRARRADLAPQEFLACLGLSAGPALKAPGVSQDFLECWGRKEKWGQRASLGLLATGDPQADQGNEASRGRKEIVALQAPQANLGLLVNLAVRVPQAPQVLPLQRSCQPRDHPTTSSPSSRALSSAPFLVPDGTSPSLRLRSPLHLRQSLADENFEPQRSPKVTEQTGGHSWSEIRL